MSSTPEDQIKRYSRHIILPEVGGKGQLKLLKAQSIFSRCGGLALQRHLSAAGGVGKIGIAGNDIVDPQICNGECCNPPDIEFKGNLTKRNPGGTKSGY